MSHRRTPSQSRGHSRMKSDDYKLLLDSDDSPVFHLQQLGEVNPLEEPLPVLIQPKLQYVSVVRTILRSTGIRVAAISRGKSWVDLFTNPSASLIVLLLVVAITLGLGLSSFFLYKPNIDKSLQSFETPNHIASERHDALKEAIKSTVKLDLHSIIRRGKRSLSSYSSYPDTWPKSFPGLKTPTPSKKRRDPKEYQQIYSRGSLDLVYLAIGDEEANIFTKERLLTIHKVEQMMMKHKGFVDFCWKAKLVRQDPFLNDRFNACTPPISLIDFFFPSNNKYFDGQGHQNLTEKSIQDTLTFLLSKGFTYWFVDDNFSNTNKKSRFLRAQLKFGFPLRGFPVHGTKQQYKVQKDMRKEFIIGYIKEFQKISTDKVQVLYGGTTIFDYEVKSALSNDVTLAIFTLLAVKVLLLVFTSFSLFLTFWGTISIGCSIPLALSIFLYVFKIKSLGILSGVSLFIIIGIGVDDVFVFINTFRQAKYTGSLHERMRYTVLTAGKATFFTSFTTAAAFAANCLSQMPAVHDFGLFMALIVSACWVTVLFTIPPALNLWYRYIAKWEAQIPKMLHLSLVSSNRNRPSTLPESVMQFLSGNESRERQQENIPQLRSSDPTISAEESTNQGMFDDEELLQIPGEIQNPNASDDEDLLQMPEERESTIPILQTQTISLETANRDSASEGLTCGSNIQELLYHFIALPILKGRYVVLAFFLIVLGASLYLNTQIQTSQKPPQFFRKSTNLQKFLDLQYNTSEDSSDCLICQDVINTGNDILTNQAMDKPTKTTSSPTNNLKTSSLPVREGNDDMVTKQFTTVTKKVKITTKKKPTSASRIGSTNKLSSGKPVLATTHAPITSSPSTASVMDSTEGRKTTSQPPHSPTTSVPQAEVPKPTTRQKKSTQLQTTERKKLDNGVVDNNNVKPVPTIGSNTKPALCPTPKYCEPADKPMLATTAVVYVVFGVKGINRTGVDETHVIKSAGKAVFDDAFSRMILNSATTGEVLGTLCEICIALANNRQLVKPGGADCFPYVEGIQRLAERSHKPHACRDLPKPTFVAGTSTRSRLRVKRSKSNVSFVIAMAFESTTYKGKSSQLMYNDYKKWEKALSDLTNDKPAAFHSAFQTSEEWVNMFREIIAVNSAIYGIVLSLCLCVAAVVIFTGHFMLALIVMLTILCVLSSVVAMFYLAGWQLGAVEAISLSILVGTSVDYCVHLVEGYILAGNSLPDLNSNKERRRWRASAAVAHIGTSLLSSALTTIFAAIPLCFTTIQFFTKFGEIVAINTATSIFYTFTVCVAMLGVMAPAKFRYSWKSFLAAFAGTSLFSSVAVLTLYLVSVKVTPIPGPSGSQLFASKKQYDFSVF